MQKFIVSAIIATVVTVGTYLFALAFGASELAAAIVAAVVVVVTAIAVVTTGATAALAAAAIVAFATATTTAVATTAAFTFAVALTFTFAVAFGVAFAVAAAVAEQEGIKYWWVFAAYALEAGAIGSAFMVDSAVWSIAIALSGVVALLVLGRFASKPIATLDAPSASTVPESNGA